HTEFADQGGPGNSQRKDPEEIHSSALPSTAMIYSDGSASWLPAISSSSKTGPAAIPAPAENIARMSAGSIITSVRGAFRRACKSGGTSPGKGFQNASAQIFVIEKLVSRPTARLTPTMM